MHATLSRFVRSPWSWIPTLYFAEGIPYAIAMTVAALMYKRLGLSNAEAALYTSWFYLPWVIKPFWSPLVERFRSKRWWIVMMQLLLGAAMAGVAFTLPLSGGIQWSLAFFWLLAFSSATHDIAADGFYMLSLTAHEQALFVGIRSTFYRVALIAGQGLIIMLAGNLEAYTQQPRLAWSLTFYICSAAFLLLLLWHYRFLPRPRRDAEQGARHSLGETWNTFRTFFAKPSIGVALAFILLYRLPEALLSKICPLFLCDPVDKGGLALTTAEIGFAQGTLGVIGLTLGGILGGIAISARGFSRCLWPMVLAITLPDLVYVYLAWAQPEGLGIVATCLFVEQFGYGYGFTAYMLYLIYFSRGASSTAHYAFCTGFMALGMMLPGMVAGALQGEMGYLNFFILVSALTVFTFFVSSLIRVERDFGRKGADEDE